MVLTKYFFLIFESCLVCIIFIVFHILGLPPPSISNRPEQKCCYKPWGDKRWYDEKNFQTEVQVHIAAGYRKSPNWKRNAAWWGQDTQTVTLPGSLYNPVQHSHWVGHYIMNSLLSLTIQTFLILNKLIGTTQDPPDKLLQILQILLLFSSVCYSACCWCC